MSLQRLQLGNALATGILLALAALQSAAALDPTPNPAPSETHRKTLSGHVSEHDGPLRVSRPGSPPPVLPGSVEDGAVDSRNFSLEARKDAATLDGTTVLLQIEKDARALPGFADQPDKRQAGVQTRPRPAPPQNSAQGKVAEQDDISTVAGQLKLIARHDVVVILDRSGSMATPDCDDDTTRWDWCKGELERFGGLTSGALPSGFRLILFAMGYQDEGMRTAYSLGEVFQEQHPGGATTLSPPLKHAFDEYLERKATGSNRHLVIAVITDGLPQDFDLVEKTIIEMTHRLQQFDEVHVTFLRVGNDPEGERLIKSWDDGLLSKGAQYDIVDSKSFEELQQVGLLRALTDAVTERGDRYTQRAR